MRRIPSLVLILLSLLFIVHGVSIDKDLTLTAKEKKILDMFKEEMSPLLPHDYMKEEIYLIRWLRAQHFNIDAAEEMLLKSLEWRKENKMDQITSEDFGEFGKEYTHIFDGIDKQGRPVLITNTGDWDVRKAIAAGNFGKLKRLVHLGFEKIAKIVRKKQNEGKMVTQYYHIYNLNGFNLIQHACPQCIAVVLEAVRTHDNNYPGFAHKVVLVNTPQIFFPLLDTIKAAARGELRETLFVYGKNKNKWQAELLKDIDKDQLIIELGGTLLHSDE